HPMVPSSDSRASSVEQFGKYTLIRKIGTGGMAEVYLARTIVAQGLNKTLVIKKIHSAYARSRQFVAMFIDEAKIALGLNTQNILLSWDGGVKIVDFGIARARDVHEEQGVIKGKFAYMSPEQARGDAVDCRSDVFAAGIVLYELVCARPLFHGKGKEALEMVKSGAIPRPRDFAPELPESLERTILRALAFHRDDRFQTARDLQHELGRFQLECGQ